MTSPRRPLARYFAAASHSDRWSQSDLFWYEEPGDPLDFELQATLRNYYKNPMATGEDLPRRRTRAT